MKIINEKGKIFGLVNIIDLGAILLVLGLLAGGLWYIQRENLASQKEMKEYTVTIKCASYFENVAKTLKTGDKFYYGKDFINAVISEVSYEDAKIDGYAADGTIVFQKHPVLKDIYIKVTVTSDEKDPMIWMGPLHATVGKEIVVKTSRVEVMGTIIDIQE